MEKKTKHKKLKVVLTIIFLLLLVLGIHTIRNYIIIKNLADKQANLQNSTNYYFVTENYSTEDENERTIIQHYTKENKNMLVFKVQGNTYISWSDKETNESIFIVPSELKAVINTSDIVMGNHLPNFFNQSSKLYLALSSYISYDNIEGIECYKVNWLGTTYYIEKEQGLLLKATGGKIVSDDEIYDSMTEYKNWTFDELTDEQLVRPNLTGYEVTYNNQ